MPLEFTWRQLTTAILKRPYLPGQVGRLGLFAPKPQSTTTANIEVWGERLALVPDMPRGAPPTPNVVDRRAMVEFRVPHFPIRDTLFADAVQDQRGFATEGLESFPTAVAQRIDSLAFRLDCTEEYLRLGAVKGKIVTAVDRQTGVPIPGREIDLFEHFEVAPQQVRDWPIVGAGEHGEASAWTGQLTELINALGRDMADELPGGMLQGIHGFAGAQFFDAVSMHPERRAAYIGFAANETVGPVRNNAIQFRGVTIEEYRGRIVGTPFVAADQCHFVGLGIPDLFIEVFAPADYVDTVNTEGLARYVKQETLEFDKGIAFEAQMNVLPLCTMPRSLFTARATRYPEGNIAAAVSAAARRRTS